MTLLVAEGLCKNFGGVVAARDVGFALGAGELLAIIGPNGAGKSTVFNMLGGQLRPDAGRVLLDGVDIAGRPARAISALGVGRTFQVAQTFLSMRVVGNVQMALIARHGRTRDLTCHAESLYREAALDLLERVGMRDAAERPIAELAYGDVKRVEFALALAAAPRLLLMDEPTAGMAPGERAALMRLVAAVARAERIGVLFTEHDMDAVFGHADRVLVLVRGAVIAAGTPEAVRADPEVRRVYLGLAHA